MLQKTDLDPRLPIQLSRIHWLITVHDLLDHPFMYFHTKFGINGFKVSPEFDSLTLYRSDFPNHTKGHGEGDTKWKGWSWKLLLIVLVIYISNR